MGADPQGVKDKSASGEKARSNCKTISTSTLNLADSRGVHQTIVNIHKKGHTLNFNPESWTQNSKDWWTAWRINLVARINAMVTVIGLFAFSFHFLGLRLENVDPRTTIPLWGLCAIVFGGGMIAATSCGHGTVRAIQKAREEMEENNELSPEWWSKRSRSYCAKVGFRAAAIQAGHGSNLPHPFDKVWSGPIPFLPLQGGSSTEAAQ